MHSLLHIRLAGCVLLALACSPLHAVLPPPSDEEMAVEEARVSALRDAAPEFLTLEVTRVALRDNGYWTQVSGKAQVVEAHRTALGLQAGDTVELLYCGRWKAIDAFWEELNRKAADGYVGPGIESMPVEPMRIEEGTRVSAWLKPAADDETALIPAAGAHSFQLASQAYSPWPGIAGETNPVCTRWPADPVKQ